jgi:CHASE3 domain sensor protein
MSDVNYTKGFNLGYDLASLSPEISKIISTAKSNDERIIGLQDGVAQYSLEIDETKNMTQEKTTVKHHTLSWMKDDRIENIDKETTKNKGKDMDKDIEPEI